MRRVLSFAIALACASSTSRAHANGRFPQAQAIVSPPGSDGSTLFLRATFGLLVSHDAGKSWRWLCERALGYEGEWDPPIAATRDGRLWIGLENGLVSTKDGCEVTPSPELAGETVKDLTTDGRGEEVWAITGAPGKKSRVWVRAGDRFEPRAALDETNFMTIDVAPSNPAYVYVSGQPYGTIRGRLYRSTDGGRTLAGEPNKLDVEGPFFIAAIDPDDPNRVLVRHLHTTGSDMLLTKDGGKTFENVLSMKSAMFGFAKSPDGKTYWAASGLPEHGIYRSTDRGETWEPLAKHGVLCLFAAPNALFVCENPFTLGAPAIGVSDDGGKTVRAIAKFSDVEGPIVCPRADAGAGLCEATWNAARATLSPRDAGAATTPSAEPAKRPSKACGCSVIGRADAADRRWTSAGFFALVALCFARRVRGSKLTHLGRR